MSNLEKIRKFLDEHHIQHAYGNVDISNNFELFEIIIYHRGLTISFIDLPDNTVHMTVTGEEYALMNLTIDKAISYLRQLFCPGELGPDK